MNFRSVAIVLKREYLQRLRSPGFIIGAVLGVLAVVALAFLPSLLNLLNQPSTTKVAVVDPHNLIYPYLPIQTESTSTPTPVPASAAQSALPAASGIIQFSKADTPDEAALSQRVNAGNLDGYVIVNGDQASSVSFTYHVKDRPGTTTAIQLANILTAATTQAKLAQLGITAQQALALFSTPKVTVEPIVAGTLKNQSVVAQSTLLVYVLLLFLYITILMYGLQVAMGVVEEKSSRIMEILVTAVRPVELMMGKVVGIGLAGLTQAGIVVVAGLMLLAIGGSLSSAISTSGVDIALVPAGTLILFLVFFLLGYLLFAALYGALGSLVSRTEDVNSITGPLTIVMVGVYLISIAALSNPDADYIKWLSFVPFFTPMLMFIRVALSNPPIWEIALSIALLIAAIFLCTWLAAKIYRIGVLMYGKRPSFRDVFRMLRTT
jgi:ABC-2 type transport system permease protein